MTRIDKHLTKKKFEKMKKAKSWKDGCCCDHCYGNLKKKFNVKMNGHKEIWGEYGD